MAQFSDSYIALLKEFEGYYSTPYVCPAGACTIGYGTNLEAHRKFIPYPELSKNTHLKGKSLCAALKNKGMVWDHEKATEAMLEELSETEAQLSKRCQAYRKLRSLGEDVRADCLLDMAYNMGIANLLGFYSTLPMIERGEYAKAAENLKLSKWYKQVGRRSRAICKMLKTGVYLTPSEIK